MKYVKIVAGKTKLRFNYVDANGVRTTREGVVKKFGKGRQYTFIEMDDELRNDVRRFSVNRMRDVVAVTY